MQREDPFNFRVFKQENKEKKFQLKAYKIIKECIKQNRIFKECQYKENWRGIHQAHYDWWAFPIDQRSSYGQEYMVSQTQVQIMKQNPQFIAALKSNAIIVCKAWAWDLILGKTIPTNHQDQRWHNWPIRLYKMARSLEIFQLETQFFHAVKYGLKIMESGKHLSYGRRDISAYFSKKSAQIQKNQTQGKSFSQKPNQLKKGQTNSQRTQSLWGKGMDQQKKLAQKETRISQKNYYQEQQKNSERRVIRKPIFRNNHPQL